MVNVLDRFKEVTKIDIGSFFEDYSNFINTRYKQIVSFYTSNAELNGNIVNELIDLLKTSADINNAFKNFRNQLSDNFDFWELIDNFEDVKSKLATVLNSKKWFRSTKSLMYDNKIQKDYVLKQFQTLSNLAVELGYSDPNNDWVDIALRNNLTEEGYQITGGAQLKVSFENALDYRLQNVLDSFDGEKVYGKDLQKQLELVLDSDDFGDFVVLEYRETIEQTYEILLNVTQGSVPEFPEDGISKSLLGSNINSLQYPVLFRQLSNLFAKDDSFVNFQILNIKREQDNVLIEVSAKTRIGETLNQQLMVV